MNPLPDADFMARVAAGALTAKYGTPVDRESAYERLTSRLAREREAAAQNAMRQQVQPVTNAGLNQMTPAQQRREIARQARELREAERAAERERKAQAAAERRTREEQARTQRQQAQVVNTVLRGVFGVLTGRRRW
jgi:hypothetical protein